MFFSVIVQNIYVLMANFACNLLVFTYDAVVFMKFCIQ